MEYKTEKYTLYNDDCITVLDNIRKNRIFDIMEVCYAWY